MAETISFVDDLADIQDIVKDAKLYFNSNKKEKSNCEYFDNKGIAYFPEDAYSIADVRLMIKLGSAVNKPITFIMDCLMNDGTYLSDSDPNFAKMQVEWDDFEWMSQSAYISNVLKPLIGKIQKRANKGAEARNCKEFFAQHKVFAGQSPMSISTYIAQKIVKFIAEEGTSTKDIKIAARQIANNLNLAIEGNNETALQFFKDCFTNKRKSDFTDDFWRDFAENYSKNFPQVNRDSVISATKNAREKRKLAKNVDSAEELMNLVSLIDDDDKNETKFIAGLTKIANESPKGSKQQKLAQFLVKLIGTPKENT